MWGILTEVWLKEIVHGLHEPFMGHWLFSLYYRPHIQYLFFFTSGRLRCDLVVEYINICLLPWTDSFLSFFHWCHVFLQRDRACLIIHAIDGSSVIPERAWDFPKGSDGQFDWGPNLCLGWVSGWNLGAYYSCAATLHTDPEVLFACQLGIISTLLHPLIAIQWLCLGHLIPIGYVPKAKIDSYLWYTKGRKIWGFFSK